MKQFLVKTSLTLVTLIVSMFFCTLPAMAGVTTKIVASQTDLRAQNLRVNPNDGVQDFPLAVITVKSEGGPTTITGFYVGTENMSTSPTSLRIYSNQSWDSLGSIAYTTNGIINGNATIDTDTSTTFTLCGDFSSQTSGWCIGRIRGVRVVQDGMSKDILTPHELHGPERRFFGGIANWILSAAPMTTTTTADGRTVSMTATFTLQVTADGVNLAQPTEKDFVVTAGTSPNSSVLCDTITAVTVPSGPIADGSTATVYLTANISGTNIPENGSYDFKIRQINWGSNPSAQIYQYWGLEDFKTQTPISCFLPDMPPAKQIAAPYISSNLYQMISTLNQADEFGQKAQLVGEGGILWFTPQDTNPNHIVVFPYPTSPDKGQVMRANVTINAVDMVPIITAPANLLGPSYGSSLQYPISNVINTTFGGVTMKTTFDVIIGEFTCHGKFIRTGDGSCVAIFYWGPGSTSDSVGDKMDLINLSPSPPEDGNLPIRYKFKSTDVSMSGNSFVIKIVSLPFSFKVKGSDDGINWTEIIYWSYWFNSTTLDDTGSAEGLIYIDKSMLSTVNLNSNRCFFKIVSLD